MRGAAAGASAETRDLRSGYVGSEAAVSGVAAANRLEALASYHLANGWARKERTLCPRCWLRAWQDPTCICAQLPNPRIRIPHRILVYIHYKEVSQMRSSNTAKLLWLGVEGAERFVFGVPEDERRLRAEIAKAGERACILYPSPGAMKAGDFRRQALGAAGAAGGPSATQLTIVVVDATWAGAKNMERSLPARVQRVCLSDIGTLRYPMMRKIRVRDRLTTMLATMLLLEQLGDVEPSALASMDAMMRALIDAYFRQNPQNALSALKGDSSLLSYASLRDPSGSEEAAPDNPARYRDRSRYEAAGAGE